MNARFALVGLWLLGGCATADQSAAPIYSPSNVLAATQKLDGREITVRGWIGGCDAQENRICGLYSNRREALGSSSSEWPLLIDLGDREPSQSVRLVMARGTYVVTCRNTEDTICPDYDGYFQVHSIED